MRLDRVKGQGAGVKSQGAGVKSQGYRDMADRNFENLRIWQEARVFVNDIYNIMSACKDWGFRDQIQRAAVSIMNNIAEGNEAGSDAKYINYLNIAKGSCSEVRSMLFLCLDFRICPQEKHKELYEKAQSISGGLRNLIVYLENKKKKV